jgi:plastocyanin
MGIRHLLGGGAAVAALALTVACGGSSGSSTPTTPSTGGGSGSSGTGAATITITSAGVSPKTVTIAAGQRVTFVNNDSRQHDMASNPHPNHTDCPAINTVGLLLAGQSRDTANLTTARSCGFHDHIREDDTSLQGTIVIQ